MDLLYRKEYTVLSKDVDPNRDMRISVLFSMLQEAAIAHTTELGMGRHMTLDKGLLWIITLADISVNRLPVYDENIVIESWPGKTMHVYFPRYSRILSESGEILIEASMIWGLMDSGSRHLIFPEEHDIVLPENKDMPTLVFPKTPVIKNGVSTVPFTVPRSYMDINGHMNNTRYFDLAEDRMHEKHLNATPKRIRSSFSLEIPFGAEVSLRQEVSDNTYALEGHSADNKTYFKLVYEF